MRQGDLIAGRYRVVRRVGSGGMGTVYEALDATSSALVALKTLRVDADLAVRARSRLLREAYALSEIRHPAVVRYVDHGITSEHGPFLVMAWVVGDTLAERLRGRGVTVVDALGLVRRLAAGLSAVHASGVVHRDLKPGNVMLAAGDMAQADRRRLRRRAPRARQRRDRHGRPGRNPSVHGPGADPQRPLGRREDRRVRPRLPALRVPDRCAGVRGGRSGHRPCAHPLRPAAGPERAPLCPAARVRRARRAHARSRRGATADRQGGRDPRGRGALRALSGIEEPSEPRPGTAPTWILAASIAPRRGTRSTRSRRPSFRLDRMEPLDAVRTVLPSMPGLFFGREAEIVSLLTTLRSKAPVVTVWGPPASGRPGS